MANPENWNFHPAAQRSALAGVLDRIGWIQNIVVNKTTGHVIDGHLRVDLAVQLGETRVPVVYVELTEDEEHLALAALDPIAGMAVPDSEKLAKLAQALDLTDNEDLALCLGNLTGMSLAPPSDDGQAPEPQIDRAKELREQYGVERGQAWEIPSADGLRLHRVICGDATAGGPGLPGVDCVVTDPPYEIKASEVLSAVEGLGADRACVLTAQKQAYDLPHASSDWKMTLELIWKHRVPRSFNTRNQPVIYHANILYLVKGAAKSGWKRPRLGFGSVIEVGSKEYFGGWHGKSVDLFVEMMLGFPGELVGDPFLGTATTLLACERMGRTLYGVELDPGILAVAIDRIARFGLEPRLAAARTDAALVDTA